MRYKKIQLVFIFMILSLMSFSQMVQSKSYGIMLKTLLKHNVSEVSAKTAKQIETAVFIDAREKKEFEVSHIKNAIWCGYNDFDLMRLKAIDKSKTIIVYCSVGYRSEKITANLLKAGYTNVFNMVGGIFEWKNNGYVVVDNAGKETEKVHAFSKTWGIWLHNGEKTYN